jgi:hypothetical protein
MSRWLLAALVVALVGVIAPAGHVGAGDAAPPDTVLDNEFIPDDRDLSDCISAVPQPGCGSEARSGWRQWLILAGLVGGLGFITWRVVRTARHSRRST